jgi:hypothetical protein
MDDGLAVLRIAGVALGLPLTALVFGWAVLRRFTHLDAAEAFAAAWGVSFTVLASSQFLAFLLPVNQTHFNLIVLIILVAASALLLRRPGGPRPRSDGEFWPLVGACALGYAQLVGIQALLPLYEGSGWFGDWWMHYDEALIFRGLKPVETTWFDAGYTIASRAPLFNLVAAAVMSVAGDAFWVYQLAASLMNVAFLAPLYLLGRELAGPRFGRLAVVLASLNVWVVHNAWFTWPKMLVVYFLLLGLHFYLQFLRLRTHDPASAGRRLMGFWVSSLLAFLTHQVAVVYMAAVLAHALATARRDRAYRPGAREVGWLLATAVVVLAPWYAWLLARFGAAGVLTSTPATQGVADPALGPLRALTSLVLNLTSSVIPTQLLRALFTRLPESGEVYRALTTTYFSQLPGALSFSLSAFLLTSLEFTRRAGPRPPRMERRAIWTFLLLGAAGGCVLHPAQGYPHGCAHSAFFPSVVALLLLAWERLDRARRRWAVLVGAGMIAEFVAMFWSHVWLLRTTDVLGHDNLRLKEAYHLTFLSDALGHWLPAAGALAVCQLVLAGLALRRVARPGEDGADGSANPAELPAQSRHDGKMQQPGL